MIVALQLIIFLPLKPELVPQSQGRAFLLEIIMDEIWKDIKGYEGIYKVSNLGRVLSVRWKTKNKLLKQHITSRYLSVTLCLNTSRKTIKVHRLVAKHFIPNPENKPEVNHINGIREDNREINLEWCTARENNTHAVKLGLKTNSFKGEKNGISKLTNKSVKEIRKRYKEEDISQRKLAKEYGVDQRCIWGVVNMEIWTHV